MLLWRLTHPELFSIKGMFHKLLHDARDMNYTNHSMDEKEVAVASHLLKICRERTSGFIKASELVRDMELKDLFMQFSFQTEGFTRQLIDYNKSKQVTIPPPRSISNILEAWMGFKSNLTHGKGISIIDVCLVGERAAIRSYKHAEREDISIQLKQIISAQLEQITTTYYNLKKIKQYIYSMKPINESI